MTEAARDFTVQEHATPNGKELGVFKVMGTSLFKIAFKSGGETPAELQGMWTEPRSAEKAIEGYLARKAMEVTSKPKRKPKKVEPKPTVDIFVDDSVEEEDVPSETE